MNVGVGLGVPVTAGAVIVGVGTLTLQAYIRPVRHRIMTRRNHLGFVGGVWECCGFTFITLFSIQLFYSASKEPAASVIHDNTSI